MAEIDIKEQNRHWFEKNPYVYKQERIFLETLKKELNYPHITAVTGPRRVGKTVLLKQIISYLIDRGVKRENILYFSFDESLVNNSIKSVIRDWERMLGGLKEEKYYVFLDEVQNVLGWAEQIKTYYDLYEKKIKFFVSGSASLNIRKGQESLAGRIIEFFIGPLSFEEYLNFSGTPKIYSMDNFKEYLQKQLPQLATNEEEKNKYVVSIVRKVIYEDAVKYYNLDNPALLDSLFKIIATSPGQILNYDDLARDLGASRNTITKYLEILEKSYLVRKLYNYSTNYRKTERKLKKYYPYFTTLINYVLPKEPEFSYLIETIVAQNLNAEFFYNVGGKEIDFIINYKNKICGVEVKIKNKIQKKDIKYLLNSPIKLDKKYLITLPEAILEFVDKNIISKNVIDLVNNGL